MHYMHHFGTGKSSLETLLVVSKQPDLARPLNQAHCLKKNAAPATHTISCRQKLLEKEGERFSDSGILGGTCSTPGDGGEHRLQGRGCHVADAKLRLGGQCRNGP